MSYSLAEAATLLDVPADKILKLVQSGKIKPMTMSTTGGSVLERFFTAEDLTRMGELLRDARRESNITSPPEPAAEFYTVAQLAQMWNLSEDVIRKEFEQEPDVLKLARARKGKRPYKTLRIPKDVAERVRRRMSS
jgi:hypothetical protein